MHTSRALFRILALLTLALPAVSAAQQVESDVSVLSQEVAAQLDGFSYQEGPESELAISRHTDRAWRDG